MRLKLFYVLLIIHAYLFCQEFPDLSSISEDQIRLDLYELTSAKYAGREAGLQGGLLAGDFISKRLQQLLFTFLPEIPSEKAVNTWLFQKFEIVGVRPSAVQVKFMINRDDSILTLMQGRDFYCFFNTAKMLDFKGLMTFGGYAIDAPEYNYNDFLRENFDNKVVLALYGEPLEKDSLIFFNGKHQTKYSMEYWKAKTVAARGGKALVLMPTPENQDGYERFIQRRLAEKDQLKFVLSEDMAVPVIYLSPQFSEKLWNDFFQQQFELENQLLRRNVERQTDITWGPAIKIEEAVSLIIDYEIEKTRNCRNIVGYINSTVKNPDYLLIGAHYDHEGMQEGKLFPGADDNASGVVANLQAAGAFAKFIQHSSLKRTLIFAFWDAEEKGQLGSQYFVEHPLIPLDQIKVVFNMDMIGRDASFHFAALRQPMKDEDAENKVMIFYSAQSPFLKDMAIEANRSIHLHLLFDPNVFFTSGSDHVNFHSQQRPVVYYFTGFHTDYTSENDTADKINFDKLTRITRHIVNLAYQLANADVIPEFDSQILCAPEGDFIR